MWSQGCDKERGAFAPLETSLLQVCFCPTWLGNFSGQRKSHKYCRKVPWSDAGSVKGGRRAQQRFAGRLLSWEPQPGSPQLGSWCCKHWSASGRAGSSCSYRCWDGGGGYVAPGPSQHGLQKQQDTEGEGTNPAFPGLMFC